MSLVQNHEKKIGAVDGLRAIAVLMVMLYHFFPNIFSIGYLGVDIFFVVSGFVISRMIINQLNNREFSLKQFFIARTRRIFPLVLLIVSIVLLTSIFWMLPQDAKSLAVASLANLFLIQNFVFSSEIGYFDDLIRRSPLLHTWSLAVEEQFYLLTPLFLILVKKLKYRSLLILLTLIVLTSFSSVVMQGRDHPAAVFFLLPFRLFELTLGVLLGTIERNVGTKILILKARENILFLGALTAACISISSVSNEFFFPNPSLIPFLISVSLIILCAHCPVSELVLGNKLLVWIGIRSYTIYMLHYPILKLAEMFNLKSLENVEKILLIVLIVLFAQFIFVVYENPMRKTVEIRQFLVVCLTLFLLIVLTASFTIARNGNVRSLNSLQLEFLKYYDRTNENAPYQKLVSDLYGRGDCNAYIQIKQESIRATDSSAPNCLYRSTNPRAFDLIVWGDSHAFHLLPGLINLMSDKANIFVMTRNGCQPKIVEFESNDCDRHNRDTLRLITKFKNARIVVSSVNPLSHDELDVLFSETLSVSPDLQIIMVSPAPTYLAPFSDIFTTRLWNSEKTMAAIGVDQLRRSKSLQLSADMKVLSRKYPVAFFDLYAELCLEDECQFRSSPKNNAIFIWDSSHLTLAGSNFIGPSLVGRIHP